MLIDFVRGQTSVILRVKLLDSSVSTGAGKTGLASSSSGLIVSTIADNESSATAYTQAGSTIETITTLGTYAAPTATKCRFKEVDATNHPGVYEIQLADARFAVSNAKSLLVSVSGVTNLAQCDLLIPLRDFNPYDAVRGGLTALPNAAAAAAGGLLTFGSSTGQVNPSSGKVPATLAASDVTGNVAADVQTVKTQTVTCAAGVTVSPFVGSTGAAVNGTNANTLSSHDPGATLGTSTLTQTQVTGGAYSVQSASCVLGDARVAHLDADVSGRMATYTQPAGFLAATFPTSVGDATAANQTTLLGRLTSARAGYLDNVNNAALATTAAQTGDAYARLGAPAGASIAADLAEIEAETDGIAAIPTSNPSAATIAAAVRDVSNSSPAAGSLGEAVRGADAKAAVIIDTIGTPANVTVSADIAAVSGGGGPVTLADGAITSAKIADGAITDAKFTVPAAAAGRPSGFLAMMRRVFEWHSNKRTRNRTTGVKTVYGMDGTTALESQTQSTTGTTDQETQGA